MDTGLVIGVGIVIAIAMGIGVGFQSLAKRIQKKYFA